MDLSESATSTSQPPVRTARKPLLSKLTMCFSVSLPINRFGTSKHVEFACKTGANDQNKVQLKHMSSHNSERRRQFKLVLRHEKAICVDVTRELTKLVRQMTPDRAVRSSLLAASCRISGSRPNECGFGLCCCDDVRRCIPAETQRGEQNRSVSSEATCHIRSTT